MAVELKDKNGNLITRDGAQVFRADHTGAVVKGSVNTEKRLMWMTGTTEAKDRDGDIIMVNGWDIKNYLKNPVFLWAHDYSSVPVGGVKRIVRRKEPKRVDFLVEFADMKDLWTFPELIMQMYADQKINTSSVGFIPRKHEALEKDEEDGDQMFPGRRFLKQELLELSGCAVPSNPEALANSMKGYSRFESLDEPRRQRILEYLIDGCHPEKFEEAKQVIEHNYAKCEFEDELEPKKVFVDVKLVGEEKEEVEEFELTEKNMMDLIVLGIEKDSSFKERLFEILEQDTPIEGKIGAVLNAKNKDLLKAASDNILTVLKSAETEESSSEEGDEKTPEHFEHLLVGELPVTNPKPPKKEPKVSAKSEDTTEEPTGLSEEDQKRIRDFTKEIRTAYSDLFQT